MVLALVLTPEFMHLYLSLYDSMRLKGPKVNARRSWSDADKIKGARKRQMESK
jgi:hypothetical protein